MSQSTGPARPFEILGRRVYPELNEVVVAGDRRRIEPRHMKVLLRLAGAPGETVERSSLLDAAWGEQTVGDDSLTQAISKLRRALDDRGGDQPGQSRLIETVPKIGYRLACAPTPISSRPAPLSPALPFRSIVGATASWAGARGLVLAGAVLVAAAAFGWRSSELILAPQSTDVMQSADGGQAAPPERKVRIRTFLQPRGAPAPSERPASIDV